MKNKEAQQPTLYKSNSGRSGKIKVCAFNKLWWWRKGNRLEIRYCSYTGPLATMTIAIQNALNIILILITASQSYCQNGAYEVLDHAFKNKESTTSLRLGIFWRDLDARLTELFAS